ncbi:phosphopantetheine-binding protein [Streptomyces sp. NPDC002766]|uniref:phosphopantetheine-binding protein n=1 Tax=Streptomyces sp. NPDC002766 TaxID=3154429 RepID=UPI00332D8E89
MPISESAVAAVSETVTKIVSDVLKQPVALTDNLLELGVDSLVGTRIVVIIRSELGVDVPLLVLFENPVLGEFVAEVTELLQEHNS